MMLRSTLVRRSRNRAPDDAGIERRTPRRRKGAVAVEFAVVAPVFFLFIFGCIEFGRLNMLHHAADNAAYEAARHAIVPGATSAEAKDRANATMDVFGVNGATVTIVPAKLGLNDDQLTVTVEIPLDQNSWILPRFTGGRNVEGTSTLRTERGKFIP